MMCKNEPAMNLHMTRYPTGSEQKKGIAVDLSAFQCHHIDLKRPLLIIQGNRGLLACGYINPATFNKTGEAGAIVTGVNTFEDMIDAEIIAVSEAAEALGLKVGDPGRKALDCFR
jgi:uncharacterized protein YunC (DUF1805 family)